jgi:hypothetical protein
MIYGVHIRTDNLRVNCSNITTKENIMRAKCLGTVLALAGGAFLSVHAAPAAVLSVGGGFGPPFGGFTCADVGGGNIAAGTTVQAWDCLAGPNQQFEVYGETIYTLGGQRCLDVAGAGTAPGTRVQSYTCNGTVAQKWNYVNGAIVYPNGSLCLDAGNMSNGTQLIVNACNASNSQSWQIK